MHGQDVVVLDGQQEILRQAANTVTKLTVTTGEGADHVTLDLTETGDALAQALQIQINTGDGNDDVDSTRDSNGTTVISEATVGAGDDRLIGTSLNSAPTASHAEQIDGGIGDDHIECVQVNPAGVVNTTMIGNNGNDRLFGHLVDAQTTANLSFSAIGGN